MQTIEILHMVAFFAVLGSIEFKGRLLGGSSRMPRKSGRV